MHLAVSELSLVDLAVIPLEYSVPWLQTFFESTCVAAAIRKNLLSLAIGYSILPVSMICHASYGSQLALAFKDWFFDFSSIEGAICEEQNRILAVSFSFIEICF
jgi:hypothetical protein